MIKLLKKAEKDCHISFKQIFSIFLVIIFTSAVVIFNLFNSDAVLAITCGYAYRKLPIYRVERADKLIAISFDCAWGNEFTQKLLDNMQFYGVKCTFFMVSFWAEKYPDEVKKIIEYGHEIGTHSKTHSHMSKQSVSAINEELIYSKKVIEDITGQKVELFRAPFGEYNNNLIDCAEKCGLYTIQWDVDSLDWKNLTAQEIAQRVISRVKSGSIILCHNNGMHTAESLPLIFTDLTARGYKFVKISDLIYKENYIMMSDGTQVKQ